MRGRKKPVPKAQLGLPFEGPKPPPKAKKAAKKAVRRKGRSRAEIRAVKANALRLCNHAYATLKNNPDFMAGRGHKMYEREIGAYIGELRRGKPSADKAEAAVATAKAVLDKMGVEYRP